jgi:hypothetical protein
MHSEKTGESTYLTYRLGRKEKSNPLFIIPGFFLHFSLESSYGYLSFEGNGKIPSGINKVGNMERKGMGIG